MSMKLPALKTTSNKLLHLDFLRFVASLGIVYFHSHPFLVDQQTRVATQEKIQGFALFVDLFFVISGFVIAYVYSDHVGEVSAIGRFMQRRVARLVPLHWLTLFASMAFWWLILKTSARAEHIPSFRGSSIFKTAFLLNGIIPASAHEFFFNEQSWSISAEMAMYLLFPIIVILAIRWKSGPLIIGILMLGGIGLRFAWLGTFQSYDMATVFPVIRALPSFFIGAGLYYKRNLLSFLPGAPWIFALSILSLIGAMSEGVGMGLILFLVYLSAVAAIASDIQAGPRAIVRRLAPLGQLTYSIYMWHALFILVLLNGIGDKLLHGNIASRIVLVPLCYGGILICSYFSFLYIETPARRWIDSLSLFERTRLIPDAPTLPLAR